MLGTFSYFNIISLISLKCCTKSLCKQFVQQKKTKVVDLISIGYSSALILFDNFNGFDCDHLVKHF